jgi:hypothetical protein
VGMETATAGPTVRCGHNNRAAPACNRRCGCSAGVTEGVARGLGGQAPSAPSRPDRVGSRAAPVCRALSRSTGPGCRRVLLPSESDPDACLGGVPDDRGSASMLGGRTTTTGRRSCERPVVRCRSRATGVGG